MEQFETQRLRLRPWRKEDLEDFHRYCKDPEVGPNAGWKPHESLEESWSILEGWLTPTEEDEIWCIEEKASGKAVGSIGLHKEDRRPGVPACKMLGYVLARPCWGQGYMTEAVAAIQDYAFRREKLRILTVNHFSFNQRSRRVIEKSGFRYEGTLRQGSVLHDGRVADTCCYSMTAGDYHLLRARKQGLALALPEELPPEAVMAYQDEWDGETMVPVSALRGEKSYEQWLGERALWRRFPPRKDFVSGTTYFLIDREGCVAGSLDLRHELNQHLLDFGGHIGYGIRPSCRGRGYAPMMLALGLEKARERGIGRALVTCNDDNIPSAATIEACGGVLENVVLEEGKPLRRYWIDL